MESNSQNSTKKILVFSPHPDDHLCAAGTLMLLKDKGFMIQEIVITGGEGGVWWTSDIKRKSNFDKEDLKETRKKEINKASEIIGISKTTFLGLSDGKITKSPELIQKIVNLITQERPEIVFTSNPKDYHSDHRELGKIVKEGIEMASWFNQPRPWKVPMMLYMEGFYFGKFHVVVDITPYLARKKAAVDIYASQICPGERRFLESMNTYRGFSIRNPKVLAAEAFEIPEELPIYLNRIIEIFSS